MKRGGYDYQSSKKARGQTGRNPNYDAAVAGLSRWRLGRLSQKFKVLPRNLVRSIPARIELKGMDTDIAATINTGVIATTNTNGQIVPMNLIQTGTGSWNRIGRKTHIKSLRITGGAVLTNLASATENGDAPILRMVIVWDKQPTGVLPTFNTIFGNTIQNGTEASNVTDPPRYDNMDRFRVLRDCRYNPPSNPAIGNLSTGAETSFHQSIDEYIKIPGLESVYSGQSTPMTIADISTGALYVIFRSTQFAANGFWNIETATCPLIGRIRYTD